MRLKLNMSILSIVLLLLLISVYTVLSNTDVREILNDLLGDIVPGVITMTRMKFEASAINEKTLSYCLTENSIEKSKEIKTRLQEHWARLMQDARKHFEHECHVGPKEEHAAEKIIELSQEFVSVSAEIIDLKDKAVGNNKLLDPVENKLNTAWISLIAILNKHAEIHSHELSAAKIRIYDKLTANSKYVVILCIIIIIAALTIELFIDKFFLRYITERNQAEKLTRVQRDLAQALSATTNFEKALALCTEAAIKGSGLDSGGVYLVDRLSGGLKLAYSKGLSTDFVQHISHYDAHSYNSGLVMAGKPVYALYSELNACMDKSDLQERLHAIAIIPVFHDDQVIGCLNIASHTLNEISGNARNTLETIAARIGDVIARLKTEDEMRALSKEREEIFQALGNATIIINKEFDILAANRAVLELTNKSQAELTGRKCYEVFHGTKAPPAGCPSMQLLCSKPYKPVRNEMKAFGGIFLVTCTPVLDEAGRLVKIIHSVTDITERKRTEEKIKASLHEKEVLLREIYHRVKNNMQIISSLLNLQSHQIKDKKYVEMFRVSQNRIKSMSLIHEKLYQSKDLANIDFKDYIKNMANSLFRFYGISSDKISLKLDLKAVSLGIDMAIPCGLIINELISNALKHAFPDDQKGEIKITFCINDENEIELLVADNGIGIPKDLDIRNSRSLGLKLLTDLAEKQLHGTIKINRIEGTEFQIKFKKIEYQERTECHDPGKNSNY